MIQSKISHNIRIIKKNVPTYSQDRFLIQSETGVGVAREANCCYKREKKVATSGSVLSRPRRRPQAPEIQQAHAKYYFFKDRDTFWCLAMSGGLS